MSQQQSFSHKILGIPLYERILEKGQGHILNWWDELVRKDKELLVSQINNLDFDFLEKLFQDYQSTKERKEFTNLAPAESVRLEGEIKLKAQKLGEEAIQKGRVCSLVLAGGQGTRLGFNHPKGMYPIGPVSGKSLFEWFAEQNVFISQKVESPRYIPWLVMTSSFTDKETKSFFQQRNFFGLGRDNVHFFMQGSFPSIDFEGKLLMDAKNHIYENPDGHGGVIKALGDYGLLEQLAQQGIQHIFIHNVDNCLTKVCDPTFLGYHIDTGADFSFKSLIKRSADEPVGTVVKTNGKIKIFEYSEIPGSTVNLKNEKGKLVFENGNANIYLVRIDFMQRLYRENRPLPVHFVQKPIPSLDSLGNLYQPHELNGIKLETKIFDILQYTEKANVLRINRNEEFLPLKSKGGLVDSYDTVLHDLQAQFFKWIKRSGIYIPQEKVKRIEISPKFAIDQVTFQEKVEIIGRKTFTKALEQQIEENGLVSL